MADKVYITPEVLRWARESARMSLETAAAKVPVAAAKLNQWEEGISQPTIKQAETLAKAYKRPFALLFLPEVPKDFQPLQDFRKKDALPLGTAAVFIIREIQQKQAWISNIYKENGEQPLPFVGRFTINDDPETVARNILETFRITPAAYSKDNPIKEWIDKAESSGIFVSRASFVHSRLLLDSDEMQGFSIADKYAPFVFVNADDWNAPQLFTLVHELAHIWIAASGVSNEIEPVVEHNEKYHPIELFCNQVAANALVPAGIMNKLGNEVFDNGDSVFRVARRFGVSTFAFLVRAYQLQHISLRKYRQLKNEADTAFQAFLRKEEERKDRRKLDKSSGPNYYQLLANKNSHLFTKVVMDAFHGGFIQPTEASNLLNTQVNNFSKLEAFVYK